MNKYLTVLSALAVIFLGSCVPQKAVTAETEISGTLRSGLRILEADNNQDFYS